MVVKRSGAGTSKKGGGDGKPVYEMRGRPYGMALEDWYEAIYEQWYNRESWCQMYERPLMEALPSRRHFPQFNRSVIRFQLPKKPMVFTMKDRAREVIFEPGRRCFPHATNSLLAKFF